MLSSSGKRSACKTLSRQCQQPLPVASGYPAGLLASSCCTLRNLAGSCIDPCTSTQQQHSMPTTAVISWLLLAMVVPSCTADEAMQTHSQKTWPCTNQLKTKLLHESKNLAQKPTATFPTNEALHVLIKNFGLPAFVTLSFRLAADAALIHSTLQQSTAQLSLLLL